MHDQRSRGREEVRSAGGGKRLPVGYVLPPSIKRQLKALTATNWPLPVLLAFGDNLLILVLAMIGYLAWAGLPFPLAAIATAIIYIVQARALRGLENLVHDGSHFNWTRTHRPTNDVLTNLLAAWPVFSSVAEYRSGNLKHHNEFGTNADPDHVRYRDLSVGTLDRSGLMPFVSGLASRMGTYIAGWWLATGTNLRDCLRGLLWHLVAVALGMCFLPPEDLTWTWVFFFLVPFMVVLPFIRFVAETGKHNYSESTIYAATISNIGFIHRWIFHPHGDGFHLLHHLHPSVPQFKLAILHKLLVVADPEGYGQSSRTRTRVLQNPHQS